jgi:DNA-directed RNA polymerase specialized sigma24 family protein
VAVADAGFEEYYATRGRALLRLAYALTGDVRDAEDLLQTALLRCYRKPRHSLIRRMPRAGWAPLPAAPLDLHPSRPRFLLVRHEQ